VGNLLTGFQRFRLSHGPSGFKCLGWLAGSQILTQVFPPEVGNAKMRTPMVKKLGNTESQSRAHSDKNVI